MAAEKINVRRVATPQGNAYAVPNSRARATYVPLPTQQKGQSATIGANVPIVHALNARATHPYFPR